MESKDITIVESVKKPGAKGEYLLVTDHEGVKFSCFQEHKDLWDILGKDMSASIGFEVKGTYKNILEAKPMSEKIQVDESKLTEQRVPPALKPDPKNRGYALSYAIRIACARIQMGGSMTLSEILHLAEPFCSYLDTGIPEEALKLYNQIQKELKKED